MPVEERTVKKNYADTLLFHHHQTEQTPNNSQLGHAMDEKSDKCIQVSMENMAKILLDKDDHIKLGRAKAWIIENKINIACWIKTEIPWYKTSKTLSPLLSENPGKGQPDDSTS